jgi:hypothetical protein
LLGDYTQIEELVVWAAMIITRYEFTNYPQSANWATTKPVARIVSISKMG